MIIVILTGIAFGYFAESIHSVTKWIVSLLFGGYTAPNILKWHWWRFNGYGFFAGMIAGILGAILIPLVFPGLSPLNAFPFILAFSAAASVIVCLMTPPEEEEHIERFYQQVRPWGFWKPVHDRLAHKVPGLEKNTNFFRDAVNCFIGITWQTSLVTTPIYIVLRDFTSLCVSVLV